LDGDRRVRVLRGTSRREGVKAAHDLTKRGGQTAS